MIIIMTTIIITITIIIIIIIIKRFVCLIRFTMPLRGIEKKL